MKRVNLKQRTGLDCAMLSKKTLHINVEDPHMYDVAGSLQEGRTSCEQRAWNSAVP